MKSLLLLAGILSFNFLIAQVNTYPDTNSVVIHKDARIDALAKKQAALNEVHEWLTCGPLSDSSCFIRA